MTPRQICRSALADALPIGHYALARASRYLSFACWLWSHQTALVRVLVTTHGASGHFHPLAPIAFALRDAGHVVAFATEPPYVATIERAGFETFPMGLDLDLHHADVMFPEMRKLHGLDQAVWALQHLFFGALPRAALPDAQELITRWRPDVVLHELSEVAGMLAAERAGLPYVSFHWTGTGVDVLALMLGDAWQELRDLAELPSDPELAALGRWLTIAAMPRSWAEPATDDRVVRIHLPQFDHRANVEAPDWLDEIQAEPFVYGTLGTMFNDTPGVLDALIAGLEELDINAVVTTGDGVTAAARGATKVRVEPYVPQSLLLPHATALVHHGGFNTLLGGLNFGLPQVFIPLAADQPILAARGVELGIGVSIEGHDQRSAAAITAATNHILTEPSFRNAAQRMKTDVTALSDIDTAVQAIVELVTP